MTALDATISLIQSDGLLILFPIAVVEGPIITVIAAYVASLGYLNLPAVFCVVVAADLVGGGTDTQTYDINYLSSGCGYWGCGTYASPTSKSFVGSGELHGVIELIGTYSSISFTDTVGENWHGLTVGAFASSVPEPGELGMMMLGLGVVGALARRRKSRAAA